MTKKHCEGLTYNEDRKKINYSPENHRYTKQGKLKVEFQGLLPGFYNGDDNYQYGKLI